MSVVLITHHNECIYDISSDFQKRGDQKIGTQNTEFDPETMYLKSRKKLIYKSQHADRIKAEYQDQCRPAPPTSTECLPDPLEYLRKRTGKPVHPLCPEKHICPKQTKEKLKVINFEHEKKYLKQRKEYSKQNKNFIGINIKKVKEQPTKNPERCIVLDRHGNKAKFESGLEPGFLKANRFGKTPKYLKQFIKAQRHIQEKRKEQSDFQEDKCRYITRAQREELLQGLKHNWEELQKQYQGLPILTDTIPKLVRKAKLEKELEELEKDIVLVEHHPFIYVYDDDDNDEQNNDSNNQTNGNGDNDSSVHNNICNINTIENINNITTEIIDSKTNRSTDNKTNEKDDNKNNDNKQEENKCSQYCPC